MEVKQAPPCRRRELAAGPEAAPKAVIDAPPQDDLSQKGPETPPSSEHEIVCPPDEAERMRALLSLGMLQADPEPRFDSITGLMKSIFATPVSAITLVAEDTIHMHSRAGQWACCAPRRGSFCDWILEGGSPRMLIVEDALTDERFKGNRYVTGAPHVRFYAGAPLIGSTGARYGTLCVIDFSPRTFTAEQYLILCHFAELATRELERDKVRRAIQPGNLNNLWMISQMQLSQQLPAAPHRHRRPSASSTPSLTPPCRPPPPAAAACCAPWKP